MVGVERLCVQRSQKIIAYPLGFNTYFAENK